MPSERKENVRIQITISPTVYRKLEEWGAFGGRSAAEFAAQILVDRVTANLDLINRLGEEQKKDQ